VTKTVYLKFLGGETCKTPTIIQFSNLVLNQSAKFIVVIKTPVNEVIPLNCDKKDMCGMLASSPEPWGDLLNVT